MKFLFIVPRYHINTHYMVKSLKMNDQKVSVFSLYQGKSEDYSIVKPVVLGYSVFFKFLKFIFRIDNSRVMKSNLEMRYAHTNFFKLFFLVKQNNPDVIVIKNIQSWLSIQSLLIAKLLSKKIIILLQIPKYREKIKSFSVDLVGKIFGAKVVTPVLGDNKYKNNNQNLFYVPFVMDVKNFDKKYNFLDKIKIICVGKIQERKGQLFLLQAIKNILDKNNYNLQVDFYGENDEIGYLTKLKQYISKNNLQNIVFLHQDVSHDKLLESYKDYDLFILPSWSEAAAFSLVEAMGNKLPVICTNENGTSTYIKSGVNGFVISARNIGSLQDKIKIFLEEPQFIKKFGQASFEMAIQNHSLNIFYQNLLKILS